MDISGQPYRLVGPDGAEWVRARAGTVQPGPDDVIKFDDPQYQINKVFEYDPLTSMTQKIRLLRLLPGSNSEIVCELFEAELRNGSAYFPPDNNESPGEEVKYEALSWSWGLGGKDNLIMVRRKGGNERAGAAESLIVSFPQNHCLLDNHYSLPFPNPIFPLGIFTNYAKRSGLSDI